MKTLLKTERVAEMLQLSVRQVKYLKAQGVLPYLKFGNRVRFTEEDVLATGIKLSKQQQQQ